MGGDRGKEWKASDEKKATRRAKAADKDQFHELNAIKAEDHQNNRDKEAQAVEILADFIEFQIAPTNYLSARVEGTVLLHDPRKVVLDNTPGGGFSTHLRAAGIPLAPSRKDGQLAPIDARAALRAFRGFGILPGRVADQLRHFGIPVPGENGATWEHTLAVADKPLPHQYTAEERRAINETNPGRAHPPGPSSPGPGPVR